MIFTEVNFVTVVVAALINFFIAWLWYSDKLFGKVWRSGHACKDDECCKCHWYCCVGGLLVSFVTAWVFAALLDYLDMDTVDEGLFLGFMIWLGFIVTNFFSAVLWSKKKFGAYLVDIGYQLVSLLFLGAILTAWQ